MNAVTAGVPVSATAAAPAPPPSTGNTASPSLLPDPLPTALPANDTLGMLFLFESNDQKLGNDAAAQRIQDLQTERQQAFQKEQQAALQQAAAENDHSFWDDLGSIFGEVAKVAAVVVSVAASVMTLGAATPIAALAIAGAVLSTAAFADGELHVLKALGVKDDTANWIDRGMAIAGSVLSAGLGAVAGGAGVASTVGDAAGVVGGIGQIAQGAATIAAGQAAARSDQAAADGVAAQAQSDRTQRWMQSTLDDTRASDQASEHILNTIANTAAIRSDTTLMAASAVRG